MFQKKIQTLSVKYYYKKWFLEISNDTQDMLALSFIKISPKKNMYELFLNLIFWSKMFMNIHFLLLDLLLSTHTLGNLECGILTTILLDVTYFCFEMVCGDIPKHHSQDLCSYFFPNFTQCLQIIFSFLFCNSSNPHII